MSYPLRLFLLFIAMPVDAFTGVVLGSYQTDPFAPMEPRSWGPSAVSDLHEGGAVMWIGGAAIMFVLIMVTFFQWTRETPAVGVAWAGWRRRAGRAWPTGSPRRSPAGAAGAQARDRAAGTAPRRIANVDEDEDQLAAYNAYLARINGPASSRPGRE